MYLVYFEEKNCPKAKIQWNTVYAHCQKIIPFKYLFPFSFFLDWAFTQRKK